MSKIIRKKARLNLFFLIFELLFNDMKPNSNSLSAFTKDFPKEDCEYINSVYFGIIENYTELSALISKYALGFELNRIFRTDFAVLLISTYEMIYRKDIPQSVSINEAVELVKEFSTGKSSSFVNGILGSISKAIY